jgi:hypothetical protein
MIQRCVMTRHCVMIEPQGFQYLVDAVGEPELMAEGAS